MSDTCRLWRSSSRRIGACSFILCASCDIDAGGGTGTLHAHAHSHVRERCCRPDIPLVLDSIAAVGFGHDRALVLLLLLLSVYSSRCKVWRFHVN